MAARTSTKAVTLVEDQFEEDEFEELQETDEDEDLEELEEEEPEEAPKPKGRKTSAAKKPPAEPKKDIIQFGSPWLASYITEVTGETYDSRAARMLLRKLAKDGKHDRVVGETRERYSFTGPNDPTVKAVIAMVKSGEAKAMKQEGLEKVKADALAKRAAKAAEKAAMAEDDEMEEEAPKPTTRRRAAPKTPAPAKATPAKAAPATRRRAAASA